MIRRYTLDAAYQLRMEEEVGSIGEGKRADLTPLNNIDQILPHLCKKEQDIPTRPLLTPPLFR